MLVFPDPCPCSSVLSVVPLLFSVPNFGREQDVRMRGWRYKGTSTNTGTCMVHPLLSLRTFGRHTWQYLAIHSIPETPPSLMRRENDMTKIKRYSIPSIGSHLFLRPRNVSYQEPRACLAAVMWFLDKAELKSSPTRPQNCTIRTSCRVALVHLIRKLDVRSWQSRRPAWLINRQHIAVAQTGISNLLRPCHNASRRGERQTISSPSRRGIAVSHRSYATTPLSEMTQPHPTQL